MDLAVFVVELVDLDFLLDEPPVAFVDFPACFFVLDFDPLLLREALSLPEERSDFDEEASLPPPPPPPLPPPFPPFAYAVGAPKPPMIVAAGPNTSEATPRTAMANFE
ncbi:hypothetical protein ACSBLW_13360 [Thioclava sp. FR2]|uniref:hypothetical protein n=1 Tax=Thioclava sp. FR2 TaxID=3445780 RepID=UPI003EB81E93